jgi:hypothetical protein
LVFLQLHISSSQELDFDPHTSLDVPEVDDRHHLKGLIALLISACIEEKLQEFCVPTVLELPRVKGQIYVNASDVLGLGFGKKQIGYPAANNHDGVTERSQYLADVYEYTARGFDLAAGIVTGMFRFGTH